MRSIIRDDTNEDLLKHIADYTGGEFFKAEYSQALIDWTTDTSFEKKFDMTDSDGDGIPDTFETAGMKISNGQIFYTNPNNADTDGDNLLDGEEIVMRRKYMGGSGIPSDVLSRTGGYYFEMVSYPDSADSDGDGYNDGIDPNKNVSDVIEHTLLNEYTQVLYDGQNVSYGGNQSWSKNNNRPYDLKYDLENGGCGIIASCDMILYMQKSHNIPGLSSVDISQNGVIEMNDYLDFVESYYSSYRRMLLGGFLPTWNRSCAKGLDSYFNTYYSDYCVDLINSKDCGNFNYNTKVDFSWSDTTCDNFLALLSDNIDNDKPVILSATNFMNEKVKMYNEIGAKNSDECYQLLDWRKDNNLKEHAVVITSIIEDYVQDDAILVLSSWGRKFYISYRELCEAAQGYLALYCICLS